MKKNPNNLIKEYFIAFKDRKDELKIINDCLTSNKFEFMLTYGRRRVGKTELHLYATQNTKTIYYLSRKSQNVEKFKEQCVKIVPEAEMIVADYESLFKFLKDKVDVIIIDEFPEMIQEDKNLLNIFQYVVDIILRDSKLKLFLLGSSTSIMKHDVLSTPSPLYGRKTIALNLKPFPFYVLKDFFPETALEEIIEIYGCSGGIPYYLNQITVPFWDWLKTELKEQRFIRDEAHFLLQYEFFSSGRYYAILEAIARGKNQLNEIAQFSNIPITSIPQYINNLEEADFIRREIPITERTTSKRGQHLLIDNFLRFYFRFIYPNLESLDQKIMDVTDIREQYSEYMGKIFEDVVLQFIINFRNHLDVIEEFKKGLDPDFLSFTKIGRWWWKDTEIDLVAFNPNTDKAILIECKWQEKVNGISIATKLLGKEPKIQYQGPNKEKKNLIMIFAKSFETDAKKIEKIGDTYVYFIDLNDMDRIITKSHLS